MRLVGPGPNGFVASWICSDEIDRQFGILTQESESQIYVYTVGTWVRTNQEYNGGMVGWKRASQQISEEKLRLDNTTSTTKLLRKREEPGCYRAYGSLQH
jgi:hypothetical protein